LEDSHLESGCAAPAESFTLDSQLARDPTSGCITSPQREEQEDRQQPWSLSQRGLTCWQIREPRDKNHRVNLVHPVGLQSPKHKLVLLSHIYIVLV
jgi:hypothetical protein